MDEVTLIPVLSVRDPTAAAAFYEKGFGARIIRMDTVSDGTVLAELAIGAAEFEVTNGAAGTPSPDASLGTTVRLSLRVPNPDGCPSGP